MKGQRKRKSTTPTEESAASTSGTSGSAAKKKKATPAKSPQDASSFLSELIADDEWKMKLSEVFAKDYFTSLAKNVTQEYGKAKIATFPPKDLIFNAFNLTPFSKVNCMMHTGHMLEQYSMLSLLRGPCIV